MSRKLVPATILTVILMAMLTLAFNFRQIRSEPRTIIVSDNFQTIQEAINLANPGDTIFVKNGTYYEHVIVNRTVSLVGENRETTIIDGSGIGTVMKVTADNVTIMGFTIRNSGKEWIDSGLALRQVKNCSLSGNNITANNGHGIYLYTSPNNSIFGNNIAANNWGGMWISTSSNYNSITGNNVTANKGNGIWLDSSNYNSIFGNNIANNKDGLVFCGPSNNRIVGNNIANNRGDGIRLFFSSNNTIFHNNFVENQQQFYTFKSYGNLWDDSYPSCGNYWSNFTGVDVKSGSYQNETGSDGIGDTPCSIDANNTDRYPLMTPFSTFKVGTWNNVTYNIDIMSNSTVSKFHLNELQKKISFNVTGTDHTSGFCRVTIPNVIIQDLWQGHYTVLVNGQPVEFRNWTHTENTYIYFTYQHSEHEVTIIPEFFLIMILPLFMIATLSAVIVYRKYPHATAQE